jgi:hypothetical protein
VDVAERRGKQVPPALAGAELLGRPQRVARRRVELLVDLVRDPVLLTADDADLELQNDVRLGARFEKLGGKVEVLAEPQKGSMRSTICG